MQTTVAETIFDIVKVLPEGKQEFLLELARRLKSGEDAPLSKLVRGVRERGESLPDEVWAEAPSDGSVNHDHYLYGSEKLK